MAMFLNLCKLSKTSDQIVRSGQFVKKASMQKPGIHNEVFLAVEDVISKYEIPKKYFIEFVDGMIMDQKINRFDNYSDLELYCYRVASVVGLICIEIFGYKGNKNEVFESYGISLLPTKVVIGKTGNIRHRSFGFRGEAELLDELEAIITILNS